MHFKTFKVNKCETTAVSNKQDNVAHYMPSLE